MKKLFLAIAAISLLNSGALAQKTEKHKPTKMEKEFLSKQADGMYAKFETSKGDIYAVLEFKKTPMTVANFVGLAEGNIKNTAKAPGTPFYDGLKFHRVIPNFMVQGGDPQGTGAGDPGYKFPDETDTTLKHTGPGILSMANSDPQGSKAPYSNKGSTNGSQFFITHVQTTWLDGLHTVFGHVVQGQDVVNKIVKDDSIRHLVILRKGKDAEAFDAVKIFEFEKGNAGAKAEAKTKAEQAEIDHMIKEKYPEAKSSPSGLKYIIEKPGEGAPMKAGDNISFHCTGYLLKDGTKFWSSYDSGQPLSIPIGTSKLIRGMDEGIMMLKQGGKAKLIIPPDLGYGDAGSPPAIPPKSWLVFDVEVIKAGN